MYKKINQIIISANSSVLAFIYDSGVFSFYTFLFFTNEQLGIDFVLNVLFVNLFSLIIAPLTNIYRIVLRYSTVSSMFRVLIHGSLVYLILVLSRVNVLTQEIDFIVLNFFLFNIGILLPRVYIKILYAKTQKSRHNPNLPKVILFGAGSRGVQIKRSLYNNPFYEVVAFIDDDLKLHRKFVDGIEVFNPLKIDLGKVLQKQNIKAVIVTSQSISQSRIDELILHELNFQVQVLYTPKNLIEGDKFRVSSLKNIEFDELLGRNENSIDLNLHGDFYFGKKILVTGAAGSIGSAILDKILNLKPELVLAIDNNETAMFHLSEKYERNVNLKMKLINVTCYDEIEHCFNENQFDYVFNAAAYKHVGVVESNIIQGLRNNILGTLNLVELSILHGVQKFIQVSTDKAVRPTNVMGLSKQICEKIVSYKTNLTPTTTGVITRFGNVIGSNGSVIPIFQDQIRRGGPVKVTHPAIERYFMSISEAAGLVLEACRIGKENAIMIFDMGTPHKIIDIAKKLIESYGFKPYIDINIEIIGLRPGEKLYEELVLDSEDIKKTTENPKIFVGSKNVTTDLDMALIEELIDLLKSPQTINSEEKALKLLKRIVPEYIPNNSPFIEKLLE